MSDALFKSQRVQLRETSGALTVADRPLPLVDLGGFRRAIVHIVQEANILTPDVDDHVFFHIDTAYGEGGYVATAELLDGAIDDTQTAVTVDDTTVFVVGARVRVDAEEMLVTASDGAAPGVITVIRKQRGTARAAHANNAVVDLLNVDWVNVANVTYDDGDTATAPQAVVTIGNPALTPVIVDGVQVDAAEDTIRALPLGDRLRIRVSVAGATAPTYNYSARVQLQN